MTTYRFGEYTFYFEAGLLQIGSKIVQLTVLEGDVLRELCIQHPSPIRDVNGMDFNSFKQIIFRLRRKINKDFCKTNFGRGYVLNCDNVSNLSG